MSIALLLAAVAAQAQVAAPCPNNATECYPWERQWGAERPQMGDVVTRAGELFARTDLASLYLGQRLSDAERLFSSRGRRMVRTSEQFAEPYALYNLVNAEGQIFGNAGVCRGVVSSVAISVASQASYLNALKRFIGQFGQPTITFQSVASDDDASVSESIIYSWNPRNLQLSYPMSNHEQHMGALVLSNRTPCR